MSQIVIVARCANGVVSWGKVYSAKNVYAWVCQRDKFSVPMPQSVQDTERVIMAIGQHSITLAGALTEVIQCDL